MSAVLTSSHHQDKAGGKLKVKISATFLPPDAVM